MFFERILPEPRPHNYLLEGFLQHSLFRKMLTEAFYSRYSRIN